MTNSNQQIADEELLNHTYLPSVFRNECTSMEVNDKAGTITYNKKGLSDYIKSRSCQHNHLEEDLKQVSTREKELRAKLVDIFFKAAGGISDMAQDEVEDTMQAIQSYIDANYVAKEKNHHYIELFKESDCPGCCFYCQGGKHTCGK